MENESTYSHIPTTWTGLLFFHMTLRSSNFHSTEEIFGQFQNILTKCCLCTALALIFAMMKIKPLVTFGS